MDHLSLKKTASKKIHPKRTPEMETHLLHSKKKPDTPKPSVQFESNMIFGCFQGGLAYKKLNIHRETHLASRCITVS